jgi:hypothetical protein
MRRRFVLGLVSLLVAASPSRGECNCHGPTELLLSLGTQALMICNGVFVSNRTLDQVYEQATGRRCSRGAARVGSPRRPSSSSSRVESTGC